MLVQPCGNGYLPIRHVEFVAHTHSKIVDEDKNAKKSSAMNKASFGTCNRLQLIHNEKSVLSLPEKKACCDR